jgi:hypothetical protein
MHELEITWWTHFRILRQRASYSYTNNGGKAKTVVHCELKWICQSLFLSFSFGPIRWAAGPARLWWRRETQAETGSLSLDWDSVGDSNGSERPATVTALRAARQVGPGKNFPPIFSDFFVIPAEGFALKERHCDATRLLIDYISYLLLRKNSALYCDARQKLLNQLLSFP